MGASEIKVDQLMHEIRQAVAQRRHEMHLQTSSARGDSVPSVPSSPAQPGHPVLVLQPEFHPRQTNHYHVNDFLKYHGSDFIRNTYRGLLKREPDTSGHKTYVQALASGELSKLDVLASVHYSPEGRSAGVSLAGLKWRSRVRKVERLPLIGYAIQMLIAIMRLPVLIRDKRRTEFYFASQEAKLAENLNRLESRLAKYQQEDPAAARETDHRLDPLYASFEDRFRGDPKEIEERFRAYLPILERSGTDEVVDLGCGRGEWLAVLKSAGIKARGIDNNRVLLERCQQAGFDVVLADVIEYLKQQPDASLGAITSFHLVEHLPFSVLIVLLDEVVRTLKPGGLLILETPNPENFIVASCGFHVDPTHHKPIPPDTLQFLLESRGLHRVEILRLRPRDEAKLPGDTQMIKWFNEHFSGAPDYAAVGWKN